MRVTLVSVLCFLSVSFNSVNAKPHSRIHTKRHLKKQFTVPKALADCLAPNSCNNTETYPTESIQELLQEKKTLKRLLFSKVNLIEPAELELPTLREPQPENMCQTRRMTVFPKVAMDYNTKKMRYIVNVDGFEQSVVYETCVNPGGQCMNLDLPFGTTCRQKYNAVRLMSLTEKGKLEYGKFLIPSTCVCCRIDYLMNSLEI